MRKSGFHICARHPFPWLNSGHRRRTLFPQREHLDRGRPLRKVGGLAARIEWLIGDGPLAEPWSEFRIRRKLVAVASIMVNALLMIFGPSALNVQVDYQLESFELGPVEGNERTLACFSAIDNLIKGGAGQAVQSMNIALGLDEAATLADAGGYP